MLCLFCVRNSNYFRTFSTGQQITGHPDYAQSVTPSFALQLCPPPLVKPDQDFGGPLEVIEIYILSKIVLASFHDRLSPASIAELSWACGRVFHLVFGVGISPY